MKTIDELRKEVEEEKAKKEREVIDEAVSFIEEKIKDSLRKNNYECEIPYVELLKILDKYVYRKITPQNIIDMFPLCYRVDKLRSNNDSMFILCNP